MSTNPTQKPAPKPGPPPGARPTTPASASAPAGPLDPAVATLLAGAIRAELKNALPHFDDDDLDFALEVINHRRMFTDGRLDVERITQFAHRFAPPAPSEAPVSSSAALLAGEYSDQSDCEAPTGGSLLGGLLRLTRAPGPDALARRAAARAKPAYGNRH